jgi:hypothetical protein
MVFVHILLYLSISQGCVVNGGAPTDFSPTSKVRFSYYTLTQ